MWIGKSRIITSHDYISPPPGADPSMTNHGRGRTIRTGVDEHGSVYSLSICLDATVQFI